MAEPPQQSTSALTSDLINGSSSALAAADILQRSCDYYGGVDTWRAIRTVRLIPGRLTGLVPWLKGAGKTFPLPTVFETSPHERLTRFVGFPTPEQVGIFENGSVRIEHSNDGTIVAKSERHRRTFSWPARARRWAPLDALYFFGYALAHYHSLPFSLFEGRVVRIATSGSKGERIAALDVELPADLHTHCQRQRFYFDALGKIVRHDYHAEIIGPWARGAHYWNRQVRFEGFPVSLERHVVARIASLPCPITALRATFTDAEIVFDRADSRLEHQPTHS